MSGPEDFYDALAPFYHLIFPDWDASMARQAAALDEVIRAEAGPGASRTVLDVACGIGTQALGLAALGYDVTASDLSAGAVRRLREEAARRGGGRREGGGHAGRVECARPHLRRGALRLREWPYATAEARTAECGRSRGAASVPPRASPICRSCTASPR